MWKVLAYGAATGSLYIYAVDAPQDAAESDVACYAYARHGMAVRDELDPLDEYLGPQWTAEWVDKSYVP